MKGTGPEEERVACKHYPVKLRRVLSAYRMRCIREGRARGPVLLLELAEEAHARMGSRVTGRPSVREWDLRRMIPLSRGHWQDLKRFASRIGLAASQLAALLIERGLDRLQTESQMGLLSVPGPSSRVDGRKTPLAGPGVRGAPPSASGRGGSSD